VIPLRIHRAAETEFWEAVAYYEEKIPGLGLDFIEEIERSFEVIRSDPSRWRIRDHGARRYNIDRFPYYIAYLDFPDHLWVVAIAHGRRLPEYWTERFDQE